MSFFFLCIDLFLLLHKNSSFFLSIYLSICLFVLSSFVSVVGGKYLMSFVSVNVCVSSITSAHTHNFSFFFFFFFFFSSSFLRVELLTLVRRTGVLASYHLCKCVCVRFLLSKHSFFIRTYCNFGHIYRADGLKENEINDCRMEFESTICIIDFCFILVNEAVKFYNNDHLSYF